MKSKVYNFFISIIARFLHFLSVEKLRCLIKGGGACAYVRDIYSAAYYYKLAKSGSYIGLGAQIAKWPIFPHGITGVFISGSAKIGKGCVIFQQVTIGSNTLPDSKRWGAPTIGDDVYIGAGAKIIGNVHVGNRCRIGANAVVVRDVPDDTVVYIGDIRQRHKEYMDNHFYSQVNENWVVYDEDGNSHVVADFERSFHTDNG